MKKIQGLNSFKHFENAGLYATEEGKIWNSKLKRVLCEAVNQNGYHYIVVMYKGIKKKFYVHRLVYAAFNGGLTDDWNYTVDRVDNDKSNNKPENLRLLTRIENSRRGKLGIKWTTTLRENYYKTRNTPEFRKKLSDNAKKLWQNPEYREKMIKIRRKRK